MAKSEIRYRGQTLTRIVDGNVYLSMSLPGQDLAANTFTATVESEDRTLVDFERNDPLVYSHRGKQIGTFYVQSISRIAKNQYKIEATSRLGVMSQRTHEGGIYTGQTVGDVLASVCDGTPYVVKSNLVGVKIYGWLPIASARDNLVQVLFAIGATVVTDLDGVLHIEGLWDGISGTQDALCMSGKIDYATKVSEVSVTGHQFIASDQTGEEILFEGTAEDGETVTFLEPAHSLRGDGLTIKSFNCNYAVLSAGTGKLYGKPFVHNTTETREPVVAAREPNIKKFDQCTLVGLVNAVDTAKRMAAYYKCTETIDAPAYYAGERPGDRLSTIHPYDATATDACLQSADITISGKLKAQEKMVVGYVPPTKSEYYDARDVLTGSGTWEVPPDVDTITVVCIDAGADGGPGQPGTDGDGSGSISVSKPSPNSVYTANPGKGGSGGAGGSGGGGGKVYRESISVTPGARIAYSAQIAHGGPHTTFGGLSAESGTQSDIGFTDPISGSVYAAKGNDGVPGAVGGSGGAAYINKVDPGANGGSVGNWPGGIGAVAYATNIDEHGFSARRGGGGGGGAAQGEKGESAVQGDDYWQRAPGGAGGNAAQNTSTAEYGCGGNGGAGGGGGGGGGGYYINVGQNWGGGLHYLSAGGKGGSGGNGGSGGAGCIILYYRKQKQKKDGLLVGSDGMVIIDKLGRFVVL